MAWQEQISGGFAHMDAPFASHALDRDRAFSMLQTMLSEGASWSEAETAIRDYLKGQNMTAAELSKQMQRVEEKLRPWLD